MSRRLAALRLEIDVLRKQFLPEPFDPVGVYPNGIRVQAHTRAFLVLSHAEVESYLEGWAKEIARTSEIVWNKASRVTSPLAFLLSAAGERLIPPEKLSGPKTKDSRQILAEIILRIFPKFYKQIKDNHGVKERNVLSLFGPLGIAAAAFSPTLLPNLEALGSIRGTHAHESAKAVTSVLDPETEFKRMQAILTDLATFDQWLVALKRQIR